MAGVIHQTITYLTEITLPPRNRQAFFNVIRKDMAKRMDVIGKPLNMLKKLSKEEQEDFEGALYGDISGMWDIEVSLGRPVEQWSEGDELLKTKNPDRALASYLLTRLKNFRDEMKRHVKVWVDRWKNTEVFTDFGFFEDNPAQARKILPALNKAYDMLATLDTAVDEYIERLSAPYRGGEPEKVETLYHASVNGREIARNGFSPTVPDVQLGLGGSQNVRNREDKGISFTADLGTAKEISRVLKEVILIAKGKVKARHIFDWAEREGIDDLKGGAQSLHGRDMDFTKPLGTFNLYRVYLAYSQRENPLIMVTGQTVERYLQRMSRLNPQNVGVVVAKVNMEHPDVERFSSMFEFRVSPEAVLSIERFIS